MKKKLLPLFVVILITFLALIPTLRNGWIDLDDDIYILENELVRDVSWTGIQKMFTTFHINGSYNPLVLISWAIDYSFVGLQPWLYHCTNLVLHLLVVMLVFYLTLKLSKNKTVALGTGLLFGIHPMHVETVAWITARKDLIYTLFYIGGLILYQFHLEKKKLKGVNFLIGSFILFAFSLLSKGSAVTFPFVLLLLDYLYKQKYSLKFLLEKIPFLLLAIVFTYISIKAQAEGDALQYRTFYSVWDSLSTGFYGYFVYLVKVFIPYRLSALHPYPTLSGTPNPWYYWLTAIPITAIVAYCISKLKTNRNLVFGFGFFFMTLIPVIQVLSFAISETADRFTYLPYFSLFYILSLGYVHLVKKKPEYKFSLTIVAVIFMSFLGLKTFAYSQIWKNSETLLTNVIRYYPKLEFPYENRGAYRLQNKQYDLAIHDCETLIQLNPKSKIAYYNLGMIYDRKGEPRSALKCYNKAIEVDSLHLSARQNRGILLTELGRHKDALQDFDISIKARPNQYSFYINRAFLFKENNLFEAAINDAQKAITLNSKRAEAYYIKGVCFRFLKKDKEALFNLNKAIIYNPNLREAYEHRGNLNHGLNQNEKAIIDYNKAIALNTQKTNIYINRGFVLLNKRKLKEAITDFNSAEKIEPKNHLVYFNRAIAYRLLGQYQMALKDISKSLRLEPNHKPSLQEKARVEKGILTDN